MVVLPLLALPPHYDGVHVQINRSIFPLTIKVDGIARRRIRLIELEPRRERDGLSKHKSLASS